SPFHARRQFSPAARGAIRLRQIVTRRVAALRGRVAGHDDEGQHREDARARGRGPVSPRPCVCHLITTSLASGGALGGGNRRCVACSNAYARPISRGSLKARPEKVTPAGPSCALKPTGNDGVTTFWNVPPGTTMLGNAAFAGVPAPLLPENSSAS